MASIIKNLINRLELPMFTNQNLTGTKKKAATLEKETDR